MFEVKADLEVFLPEAQKVLTRNNRPDLGDTLEEPRYRHLFLQAANHPMGYEDGPSGIGYERMARRYNQLDEQDYEALEDMGNILVRELETKLDSIEPEEALILFEGTNHILQPIIYKNHHAGKSSGTELAERMMKVYLESSVSIPRWDAQIAENEGFKHVENLNGAMMDMMLSVPFSGLTYGGLYAINPELAQNIGQYFTIPSLLIGAYAMLADQFIMLPLQDAVGDSPATDEKLVTGKHFSSVRHPLHATRMFSMTALSLAMLNPVSWFIGLKALYNGCKASAYQDERLRLIHGDEARDYQERVPAFIPGANTIKKGLEALIPPLKGKLDFKLSNYLERIPGIERTTILFDEEQKETHEFHGNPTAHLSVKFGPPNWKRNLGDLGRAFIGVGLFLPALGCKTVEYLSKGRYCKGWGEQIMPILSNNLAFLANHPLTRTDAREEAIIAKRS